MNAPDFAISLVYIAYALAVLLTFGAICSVGAVANVGIATAFYEHWSSWWQAGLAGALVGSVWNYAVSAAYTWKR